MLNIEKLGTSWRGRSVGERRRLRGVGGKEAGQDGGVCG